jgi:hypothetical protein
VAINSSFQAIQTMRQFIKEGGLTIITEFVFNHQPMGFRTSIQLDGCMINFIPDPACFSTPEQQQLLQTYLKQHLEKVQELLTKINNFNSFLQQIFYTLFTSNAVATSLMVDIHEELGRLHPFLAYLYEIHPYLVNLFWFIIGGAMGGLFFYYVVIPSIGYFILKKVRKTLDF